MSQSSDAFAVADGSGATVRAAINADLQALVTLSSGSSAPSSPFAYQFWEDTSTTPPTLRQRNAGNTGWIVVGNSDGTANQFNAAGLAGQCRLTVSSSTVLKLMPYNGNRVPLNGGAVSLPSGGVSATSSGTFVSGVGATGLAASTAYLVYLFNNGGTLALDFWPIAGGHVTDTSAGNVGVEVRSNSGSPDSTRTLVGAVLTNGSGQFQSNVGAVIGVANWFNRRTTVPGLLINASTSSTTIVQVGGSLTYFQWSDEESVCMTWFGTISMSTANGTLAAIGFGTTEYGGIAPSQPVAGVPIDTSLTFFSGGAGVEGFLSLNLIGQVGGGTATYAGTLQAACRC